jgi:succinyl-diaminopimelate desuccinylase
MSLAQEILQELVSLKTISGKYPEEFEKAWKYIDSIVLTQIPSWGYREYSSGGFKTRVYSHKKYIATDEKDFDIYLYGNIDVVGGEDSLFSLRRDEGKLIGRGVIDMKFGVACSIETLCRLSAEMLEQKIALIITTDEELGGIHGARFLVDSEKYRGKCIIGPNGMLSESHFNLEIQNKGTIHTKYSKKGIAAHGSRPWQGDNAIDTLFAFYQELKQAFNKGSEKVYDSTLNLGSIQGGIATNVVAEEASINIDFRYVSKDQAEEYYLLENELIEKYKVKKELIVDAMNISVDKEDPLFKQFSRSVEKYIHSDEIQEVKAHGSHDIREFFKVGMFPIIFTPRGGDNHKPTEWIWADDLEILCNISIDFITTYFND